VSDIDWENVKANLDRLTTEALADISMMCQQIMYDRLASALSKVEERVG